MEARPAYRSIVFMGQACSGKGTQSGMLAEKLGYVVFSMGDKTRAIAAEDSPLGRYIAGIHTTGWIPEWLASYLMSKALLEEHTDDGLVFESVTRKPEEAEKFHEMHAALERPYIVIYLEADESTLIERMRTRDREGYDTEEKIEKRLKAFENETMHSIEYYREQGVLRTVNADQTPEEVFSDVLSEVMS